MDLILMATHLLLGGIWKMRTEQHLIHSSTMGTQDTTISTVGWECTSPLGCNKDTGDNRSANKSGWRESEHDDDSDTGEDVETRPTSTV